MEDWFWNQNYLITIEIKKKKVADQNVDPKTNPYDEELKADFVFLYMIFPCFFFFNF